MLTQTLARKDLFVSVSLLGTDTLDSYLNKQTINLCNLNIDSFKELRVSLTPCVIHNRLKDLFTNCRLQTPGQRTVFAN